MKKLLASLLIVPLLIGCAFLLSIGLRDIASSFSPPVEAALLPRSTVVADRAFDVARYMKCLSWAEEVVGERYTVVYGNGRYHLYSSTDFGILASKLAMDRYKIEMGIACGSE